jgi:hypothetical protein
MNDLPRQKLRAILSAHGRGVCKDPEFLGALLAKVCPDHPREVQVLYYALDSFLADKALDDLGERPWKSIAEPIIDELVTKHSMNQEEADWAATSWGVALGEISEVQADPPVPASPEGQAVLASNDRVTSPWLPTSPSNYPLSPGSRGRGEGGISNAYAATPRPGASSSLRVFGVLAAVFIGGLILTFVLLPGVTGLKTGNLFLDHPASYWSEKLKEPVVRKEVWQGHQRIMKDVDPAADLAQPEAVPVLIELLQDDSPIVRQKTITILTKIGSPAKPAIPALQQATKDSDGEVRSRAVEALRKLDPESAQE